MNLILAVVAVLVLVAIIGLEDLKALKVRHDVHSTVMAMINDEGAGSWPPRATHDEFPPALRAYRQIYAAMAPLLPTANPSLDDESNKIRCQDFRSRMQTLLSEKVDMMATRSALEAVQSGNWDTFPRDAYNGFYSCIACLRHAYRWASNPVLRVTQEEKQLHFPLELDMPWSYIQRRFDITSPSGNIMSNVICNLDSYGQIVYPINEGMSDAIRSTELAWCHIFYDSETMAIPIYYAIIQAIISFERGDKKSCLAHIETVSINLRKVLLNLYEKMNDPHVARAIWVRHISGVHSWGLTHETDGSPVEYGGLSGSQILLFLAVDAFLGIDRYHSDDQQKRHISLNLRNVAATIRRYSFRKLLSEKSEDDIALENAFQRMVKQLRSFRAVHKVRAVRYLSAPAPERVPMTAALSVLPSQAEEGIAADAFKFVDRLLTKRLNETV
ncbi:hypothetical protein BKA67DRAFT_595736 [Truncatella angustata]|uniref:Indoleamine 2,3-dioxygenase n=1 Tax=Truncatella angustata TaxID=152316 RepID=A0A9P8RG27_9PEZI|nr:uncharacterized protein BKA67DRAFT_595736 [Truncatella angustata]KAH6645348.1 hypothetical protein BKA67DRAFT_595736 [Truncatella angustata]